MGKNALECKLSDLVAVVSPRGPLHAATLDVEGEVLDVDVARAPVNAVAEPHDLAGARHDDIRVDDCVAVLRVGAATKQSKVCTLKTHSGTHLMRELEIERGGAFNGVFALSAVTPNQAANAKINANDE